MLYENYPELLPIKPQIDAAIGLISDCYRYGCKIMTAGNGGSAADSEHIVGELMKGFKSKRPVIDPRIPPELAAKLQGSLAALSLSNGLSLPTAYLNDVDSEYTIAQTMYGLAKAGDLVILISTSGNAKNLVHTAELAHYIGVKSIALTGAGGGKLAELCDLTIKVPATETYRIQEYHLPVYHELCARVEEILFPEMK